ncbi:restriction endonuclease [bacterium]
MLTQIRIEYPGSYSNKEKGDFLEDLIRSVMEKQRYRVTQRVKYTGTEIDLLCKHMDRADDTALVECKARQSYSADDIKNFSFDLIVTKKAKYGYFVHTTELQQNAAGIRDELEESHGEFVSFIGPMKLLEWLEDAQLIVPYKTVDFSPLNPTKRILLYTPNDKYWVTLLTRGGSPSHYYVISASNEDNCLPGDFDAVQRVLGDELIGLNRFEVRSHGPVFTDEGESDIVAEIQEADAWTDLRPVGARFFLGRTQLSAALYKFIKEPLTSHSSKRIFFVEGKSGWGKSSLLAHLRARSKYQRNRKTYYLTAVDSRSAESAAFVGMALNKLVRNSARDNFLPEKFEDGIQIPSWFDITSDQDFKELADFLESSQRVLVLVFDQFEDVFRKAELFRTFHKFMIDISSASTNFILGFSWRSEINIPMDNPAYSLWQQARSHATTFKLDRFSKSEIDGVISQLQMQCGQQLPATLKRRLREGSQGFPWLIKKLAIHCYNEIERGTPPDALVDQDLNVQKLFEKDREELTPSEARALKHIARRAYQGDPFDVVEVDDSIQEDVLNRLLSKRLIVRTGGKYNIYWDIFRDFLVEDAPPRLAESFLLRQYPTPCQETLNSLIKNGASSVRTVQQALGNSEGTTLNHIRELRNIGVVVLHGDLFSVRERIQSEEDFKKYMKARLEQHVVINLLRKSSLEVIDNNELSATLRSEYTNFDFTDKTWATYGRFLVAWLQYCDIDLGGRLVAEPSKHASIDQYAYTPQSRPEKVLEIVTALLIDKGRSMPRPKERKYDKPLYDLKAFGLLTYRQNEIILTKKGIDMVQRKPEIRALLLARSASKLPKIRKAVSALSANIKHPNESFEDGIADILDSMPSVSYRKVTKHVLRSWASFILKHVHFV